MRRLIIEEPTSVSAIWSRRLGLFALAVAAISVALARTRPDDLTAALAVIGAAVLIACLAILLACTGAVVIWRKGEKGAGIAVVGLVLAGIVLAYPAYLAYLAVRLPLLNDISTDLVDPPAYSPSAAIVAERGGVTPAPLRADQRATQQQAYPNVQPILLDLEADDGYQLVLKAVRARGWRILYQAPPASRSGRGVGLGHVDAVQRSLFLGFPSDVTIRVRPLAGQTRIDIRSASRYGRHDFGFNARVIEAFSEELQNQLDAR